jgi:hypothetical protein
MLKERRKRVTNNEWVFPSDSKSGHVTDVKNGWAKLLKEAHLGLVAGERRGIVDHHRRDAGP